MMTDNLVYEDYFELVSLSIVFFGGLESRFNPACSMIPFRKFRNCGERRKRGR